MDSTEEEPPSSQPSYMVGFIIANIVGIQYYRGTISGREMVGLVREPLNPFDPNAIKVLNTRTIQLGHIERNVAKVLAPLVDSELVTIEGIVPNTRSTGNKFRIPCQIHLFAKVDDFGVVKERILGSGLAFVSETDAGFGMSEAVVVKERNAGKRAKSLDEIFKGVKRTGVVAAVDAPGEVVVSELLVHQKEALGWLLRRENSGELPPFWEDVEEKEGGGFVNVLTNFRTDKRPEALRGGIFADDMGLGKTLVMLSLIAFDRFGDRGVVRRVVEGGGGDVEGVEDDEVVSASGGKKGKRGRGKRKDEGGRKKRKIKGDGLGTSDMKGKSVSFFDDGDFCEEGHKRTLIVCPPVVFSTWVTQILEHTKRGSFKMYMYYGDRTRDVEELKKYDIVLTTYSTLAAEESWAEPPMRNIEWWRVILDEAHVIKNAIAQQSRAVTNLNAKRRWVVTGTPIQNGSFDLFSLMAFLRFEPFSVKSYWQSLVQRPLAQGNKKGLSRLQILMATISLRRTKDNGLIGLPPKSIETFFVELAREERELYDHMEGEAKNIVQNYMNSESFMRNYSTILSVILRLRQICTDMALCPSELKSVLPSYNIEDVSNNPELLKKVVEVLQDGEDFDCPICISPPTDLVITCCAHIFCRACILKTLQRTKACCPLCRRPLSQSDLFSAPPESSDIDKDSAPSTKISSKVSALLKFLVASRDENPLIKSVVFSQFRKMLILLEVPLKAAGFKILRLDGSMNAKKRAQVIQDFGVRAPDGPTILLASLKASGAGINLTAASRVYLLEPWWNPAVEEQAMDRVHRIGQKENVKIVRLIARNSIEERILELQERKKQLAREAFGRRGSKEQREVGMDDIRVLMSL